ncbi:MAG: hypothetical protein NTU63_03650 [Candidatus Pacearchaeota archaeon]|nr:hypothetical protein [Candidatus Pacearchaeota archaeon]
MINDRWGEALERQYAYGQGQNDARFGKPESGAIFRFSGDYHEGYEKMKKIGDDMQKEEERQRQLRKTIDAIKTHKNPWDKSSF